MGVASKFGLGIVLHRLGLAPAVGEDGDPRPLLDLPRRTRMALEQLGPTFVKLGQILATRGDIIPPDWIAEFERLHSQAPVLGFEELRPFVEDALGQSPETAFAHFDEIPLAAASMAQVHRATLHDGRLVVLKIRRPGIRPTVEADLRLIAHLAELVERGSAAARRFNPTAMMRQLAEAMLEELDFTIEGRNGDRLRADFRNDPRVVVPVIHWEWTSEALLVMDYVVGTPPRDGTALRAAGIDPARIAAIGADIILDMVLVNGRFHGDPHPGNLLCLPGDRIALLDLGMVGYVSPRRREEFISFVQALSQGDPAQLADVLTLWSTDAPVPPGRVLAAAERLIARHGSGTMVLRAVVMDFLALMRDEGMTLPADLLLIFKALVTIDGVLMGIEPDFDLTAAMRRSTLRIARARLSPEHWTPVMQTVAWELAKVGDDASRMIRALVRRLEGDLSGQAITARSSAAAPRWQAAWLPAAILASAAMIATALLLR